MTRLPSILATLGYALFAVLCAAQALGPAKDPAPVDPGPAVAAVNQLAASANANINAGNAKAQQQAAQVAQLQQQLAAAQANAVTATQPAIPWLGVNDEQNDYYGVCRWADAMHCASGWSDWSGGKVPYTLTQNGYPVGNPIQAVCQVWVVGCSGDCNFSWAGTGAVNVSVIGGSYKSTGPQSGVVSLPAVGAVGPNQYGPQNPTEEVIITVTGGSPSDPIRDMHLWLPGYGPGTPRASQVYRDEYLSLLKPFAGLRVMNSLWASYSTETDWSTRVQPTAFDWTTRGVPHEAEIEIAKEAGIKLLWVCLPFNATPDYVTRCSKLYHDSVPPGTIVVVETANELWSWGFGWRNAIYKANQANPAAVNGFGQPASGDPNVIDPRLAAERCRANALIFKAAYADRPGDLKCVFAGQAAWSLWIDSGLAWLTARYGAQPFDWLAIAPYYDWNWNNNVFLKPAGASGAPTLDDLFASLNRFFADNTPAGDGLAYQLAQHAALAQKYHAQLVDYEGDQAFAVTTGADGFNPDPNAIGTLAQTDPRMGLAQDQYYAVLHHGGVAMHFGFALVGDAWSKYGFWSVLRTFGDDTPRWDSMCREALRSN